MQGRWCLGCSGGQINRVWVPCRADALLVLNMVMAAAPQHVTGTYLLPALQHYAHLLAPSQRARSVSAGSMKNLLEVHPSHPSPSLLPVDCSGRAERLHLRNY